MGVVRAQDGFESTVLVQGWHRQAVSAFARIQGLGSWTAS